jgi:hypothetical protein
LFRLQAVKISALSPEVALAAASTMNLDSIDVLDAPAAASVAVASEQQPSASTNTTNSAHSDSSSSSDDSAGSGDEPPADRPRSLRLAEASGQYVGLPDLAALDLATIMRTIKNTQIIIVHNTMDFASIDLRRRCECACLAASAANARGVAASCTGGCM